MDSTGEYVNLPLKITTELRPDISTNNDSEDEELVYDPSLDKPNPGEVQDDEASHSNTKQTMRQLDFVVLSPDTEKVNDIWLIMPCFLL